MNKMKKTSQNWLKRNWKRISGYSLIVSGLLFLPTPFLPGSLMLLAGYKIIKMENKNE